MTPHSADASPHLSLVCGEPAAMQVQGLSIRYEGRTILSGVDLRIPPQGLTCLIGPSGCGKSSFLRCLNRLVDLIPACQVQGRVLFRGEDILAPQCDVVSLRQRIGLVFQKPNPFPFSIRRNLALADHARGDDAGQEERIRRVLTEVGLWDEVGGRLDGSACALSGGQQQRLCIARALMCEPAMLLLDEPCSSLDPLSAGRVEECVRAISRSRPVVMVTHDLRRALQVADHLVVFWCVDGTCTVIDAGTTAEIRERPTSPLTRMYLATAA